MAEEADPDTLELALDQLRHELELQESQIRGLRLDLASCEARIASRRQQLLAMKQEARVVLLSEYRTVRNLVRDYRDRRAEILQAVAVIQAEAGKNRKAIGETEQALQVALRQLSYESMSTKTNILEFPHAKRRRDPDSDPDGT